MLCSVWCTELTLRNHMPFRANQTLYTKYAKVLVHSSLNLLYLLCWIRDSRDLSHCLSVYPFAIGTAVFFWHSVLFAHSQQNQRDNIMVAYCKIDLKVRNLVWSNKMWVYFWKNRMMEYFSKHDEHLKSKISLLPGTSHVYCNVEALYSNEINKNMLWFLSLVGRCPHWPHLKIVHQCCLIFVAHLVGTDTVTKLASSTYLFNLLPLMQAEWAEEVLTWFTRT